MIDREKVANGLRHCLHYNGSCFDCPYDGPNCQNDVLDDAIALLKEKNGNIGHWVVLENCSNAGVYCSECQTKIFDRYQMKKKYSYFCPHCGARMDEQAVKL